MARLFGRVVGRQLGCSVLSSIIDSVVRSSNRFLDRSVVLSVGDSLVKSVGWRLRRLALLSRLTRSFEGAVGLLLVCTVTQSVVGSLVRPYRRLVAGSLGRPVGW